jgi:hypothetical protein
MPPTAATADTPTIGELLDLPTQVFQGDFVLELSDALQNHGLTIEQCRSWRPLTPAKRPRQCKARG